jgi:opacity protein-like surface antigen
MKKIGSAFAALVAVVVLSPLAAVAQVAPAEPPVVQSNPSAAPVVLPDIFSDDAQPLPRKEPRQPRWGVGFRYGATGASSLVLDLAFDEHPSVSGSVYGVEVRYYGEQGSKSTSSVAFSVDFLDFEAGGADGKWQEDADSDVYTGGGDMKLTTYTFTAYHDFFAGMPIHPYAGFGIGYAKGSGNVTLTSYKEIKTYSPKDLLAIHIPVGVTMNIGRHATVRAEARYLDSLSYGLQLMANF